MRKLMTLSLGKYRLFLGGISLCLLSLSPCFGQLPLVYTHSMPLTQTAFNYNFTLPAFDSNLGTLDLITFSFVIYEIASVDVTSGPNRDFFGGSFIVGTDDNDS